MLFAPTIVDELDPTDGNLTTQRYISRYIDLCRQLGFKSYSLSDDEIRSIDYQIFEAAKKRGLSDDDIELIIWHGSQIARRLDDSDRDIYAQSFTLAIAQDLKPDEPMTTFVDSKGNEIEPKETYSIH